MVVALSINFKEISTYEGTYSESRRISMADDNLQVWESIFMNREWGKYPPLSLVRFIAKNYYKASDRSAIKILELGSGTGANLWYLSREGFTVYGIDGSKTACEKAKQRLITEGLSGRIGSIIVGDYFDQLDFFADEYFDAIIDIGSLCCNSFDRAQQIIIKSIRKLRAHGRLFSQTFADGTWGLDFTPIGYNACYPIEGPMAGEGYNRFTSKKDISKLYQPSGSKIVSVQRQELHIDDEHRVNDWLIELEKL